jgi:hypothetical protein
MNECIDGWMDGRTDEQMDGRQGTHKIKEAWHKTKIKHT